ncbi:hypothetical protein ACGC1H_006830 [Rhizoctonia solani]
MILQLRRNIKLQKRKWLDSPDAKNGQVATFCGRKTYPHTWYKFELTWLGKCSKAITVYQKWIHYKKRGTRTQQSQWTPLALRDYLLPMREMTSHWGSDGHGCLSSSRKGHLGWS